MVDINYFINSKSTEELKEIIEYSHKWDEAIVVSAKLELKRRIEAGESSHKFDSKISNTKEEISFNTKEKSDEKKKYVKYVFGISIFLLVTLPFHYVPSHFTMFPKDSFTFNNTFIFQNDIDNLIQRHNSGSFFERATIMNEPLFKKLYEKGFVIIKPDTLFNTLSEEILNQTQNTNNQVEGEPAINQVRSDLKQYISLEDSVTIEKIKQKIKKEYPTDYSVQKILFDQNVTDYIYLKQNAEDFEILNKFQKEYPYDFSTQKMLYNQEILAKEQMK